MVVGLDNDKIIPIQQTIERATDEEDPNTSGLDNIIFVEPTTVVEVNYEVLLPDRKLSFALIREQSTGKGRQAAARVFLKEKPTYARRMRSPRIVAVRDDKNALKYSDVNHEQGEAAGGFKIGARPNPPESNIKLPLSLLTTVNEWVLAPITAEKQGRRVPMQKEELVERSFVGKVNADKVFQAPIDMWRKLHRLMDRSRENVGFVKDNAIYYGSSHMRSAVDFEMHEDMIGCDFMFHTHPYSRLFKTELGYMSPQDLMAMSGMSLFGVEWHVIAEMYGFECVRTTPTEKTIKILDRMSKAYKKNNNKDMKESMKELMAAFKSHRKIVLGAFNNKTSARRKFVRNIVGNAYSFTPFDVSALTVDEVNSKSEYFQYEYYTLPLPLYSVAFKGDYPQLEILNNPAFYGYQPERWIRGKTPSEDRKVDIKSEFQLAHDRAYGFDRPPGDQKMYLFGTQARGQSGGYQSPRPVSIRGTQVYLDASNLPFMFANAIQDTLGEGQDAAKMLPKYDSEYTVPKSWYDIEQGLYNKDAKQDVRDLALGIRVAWDAGRPTEQLEAEEFYNKWFENLDEISEEFAQTGKESKLTKDEKRKLVKLLEEEVVNNPAFVSGDWEDRIDAFEQELNRRGVNYNEDSLSTVDVEMQSLYPEWEYNALEKARQLRLAEEEHGYSDEELAMIRLSYSPQTLSVSLESAFIGLYGPSLIGEYEEEVEDDDGTVPEYN